jgi:hypothetical protein
MSILLIGGIIAGLLQLWGYILYIKNEDIDPEPVTWFMFAYGTLILAILEWDANATFAELILPTVCGALAIYVSYRCWKKARKLNPDKWWPKDWWPEDTMDKLSFVGDIVITITYIIAWVLAGIAFLDNETRELAVLAFLFLSNLSTFPSFYPILHSTWKHPEKEHWTPWIIWSIAYAVLALVTWSTHNAFWHALMFYPVSNAVLHALVGILSLRKKQYETSIQSNERNQRKRVVHE